MTTPTVHSQNQFLVWWVIWAAFLVGIVQTFFILNRGAATEMANTSFNFLGLRAVCDQFAPCAGLFCPNYGNLNPRSSRSSVGIAIAESSCFLGLFLLPSHKFELFALSVIGIAQYAPFFARKYFP